MVGKFSLSARCPYWNPKPIFKIKYLSYQKVARNSDRGFMGVKKFFVNNGGQNLGPFSLEAIFEKVTQGEFQATDHIYLDERDDWILICQHPEFLKKFTAKKPAKTIEPKVESVA